MSHREGDWAALSVAVRHGPVTVIPYEVSAAPFVVAIDPLLRNRNRTERLFDFHYRIEVFVPEAKRQYGYYVFPLLEGDRLVGRIDMKCKRDRGTLAVKGLWLEPRVKFTKSRQRGLEAELERQRRFSGAERVSYAKDFLKEAG